MSERENIFIIVVYLSQNHFMIIEFVDRESEREAKIVVDLIFLFF